MEALGVRFAGGVQGDGARLAEACFAFDCFVIEALGDVAEVPMGMAMGGEDGAGRVDGFGQTESGDLDAVGLGAAVAAILENLRHAFRRDVNRREDVCGDWRLG